MEKFIGITIMCVFFVASIAAWSLTLYSVLDFNPVAALLYGFFAYLMCGATVAIYKDIFGKSSDKFDF